MSAFDFPPPSLAATMLGLRGFVGLARNMRLIAAPADFAVNRCSSVAFIETQMLRHFGSGIGRWTGIASSVARASGTPRPSISVERLTPTLPRSVGFSRFFPPPSGALVVAPSIRGYACRIALRFVGIRVTPRERGEMSLNLASEFQGFSAFVAGVVSVPRSR